MVSKLVFFCKIIWVKLSVLVDEASEGGNTGKDWWQVDLATESRSERGDTNQNVLSILGSNKRTTRVTAAGTNTSNTTGAEVRSLENEGEGEAASAVSDDVQANVAQDLVGADAST